MSDDSKAVPTRETAWGRWSIIREVRPPTKFTRRYKDGRTRTENVSPGIVKAVLLDLAQWDAPGSEVYKGVRNISHATGVSKPGVDKALRVLREAGLLKRTPRGIHQTSVSVLDWDRLEALRVPFRDTFVTRDANDDDLDDLDLRPAPPVEEPKPEPAPPSAQVEPSADLVASIRALKHIGDKLSPRDAQWVAANLAARAGEDGAIMALDYVEEKALAKASSPDIRKKAAYLLQCTIEAFRVALVDHVLIFAPQIRGSEGATRMTLVGRSDACMRFYREALVGSLAEEFEIGELSRDDEQGWFLPITPRAAAVA